MKLMDDTVERQNPRIMSLEHERWVCNVINSGGALCLFFYLALGGGRGVSASHITLRGLWSNWYNLESQFDEL